MRADRPISAVGEHIIAGITRVQQPFQLLAVVHGRIGHCIMPDQLALGVRVGRGSQFSAERSSRRRFTGLKSLLKFQFLKEQIGHQPPQP